MNEFLSEEMLERKPYWGPVVLAVFTAALFLRGLGARDLWAPGEPIYGEIIRVMYEKNHWLVPMLNGQLYADKPVLYFWLAPIFFKIGGGVNEWTVRLPASFSLFSDAFLPWTLLVPGALLFYYPWKDKLRNPPTGVRGRLES